MAASAFLSLLAVMEDALIIAVLTTARVRASTVRLFG